MIYYVRYEGQKTNTKYKIQKGINIDQLVQTLVSMASVTDTDLKLGRKQKEAIKWILNEKSILLVGGGPSGKSTTINCALNHYYDIKKGNAFVNIYGKDAAEQKENVMKELETRRKILNELTARGVRTEYSIDNGPITEDENYYYSVKHEISSILGDWEYELVHSSLPPIYPIHLPHYWDKKDASWAHDTNNRIATVLRKMSLLKQDNIRIMIMLTENAEQFIDLLPQIHSSFRNTMQWILVTSHPDVTIPNILIPDLATVHLPTLKRISASRYCCPDI